MFYAAQAPAMLAGASNSAVGTTLTGTADAIVSAPPPATGGAPPPLLAMESLLLYRSLSLV